MIICRTINELRAALTTDKRVLVPTMGALHNGHGSLITRARCIAGDSGQVIVSIFVNPTQFDRKEDLDAYPETFQSDTALCESLGADIIFAPQPGDMYQENRSISIAESSLSRTLCGATRPGHFDGVCLVVNKLFNAAMATHAIFGEKDFQQLAIIKRMVRDLNMPIEVIGSPTIREESGLAMSSRNLNLTAEDKQLAPEVYKALRAASSAYQSGETSRSGLIELVSSSLTALPNKPRIDYLEIVDEESLESTEPTASSSPVMAIAIFFGKVRLIDHIHLH